jgi:cytoskeletal protein CcmA (bactofilin family)
MWKKDEAPAQTPTAARPEPTPRPERHAPAPAPAAAERASIGRSITIKGEVTGDEDLLIQGRVDGSVDLKQHSVTVGPDGEVKASITARVVTVEGRVEGDLSADEQVILRSSATVHGDITAPRVVLEDGARFRGGVDMGEPAKRSNSGTSQDARKAERSKPTPEPIEAARSPKGVSQSPAEVKS